MPDVELPDVVVEAPAAAVDRGSAAASCRNAVARLCSAEARAALGAFTKAAAIDAMYAWVRAVDP